MMQHLRRPEDRHGQLLLRQLKPTHERLLHEITLTGQVVLRGPDLEGGEPLQRGDISYFSLLLMMEALAHASFKTFMEYYAPAMNFEVSYDDYHEFKLASGKVLEDNRNITSDNFLGVEEPELVDDDPETPLPDHQGQGPVDPEYKGTIESLNVENKHIILESGDDNLVECTLQWISMCNKNVQRKIKERVVEKEARQRRKKKRRLMSKKNNRIHRSHMFHLEALLRIFHLNALLRKRNQGKRRQTFRMMKQLQKKNLPQDFTMVKTSLETRMIQFFGN